MSVDVRMLLGLRGTSKEARSQLERANRNVLRYETVFITVLVTLALVSTLFPIAPWATKTPDAIMVYRAGFFLVGVASILGHFACVSLAKEGAGVSKRSRAFLISYTLFLLVAAAVVTAYDYANSQTFFLYVAALVLVFGLLYIQPLVTIAINIIYSSLIITILSMRGNVDPLNYLLIALMAFFIVIVSVSNYHTRLRSIMVNEQMREVSRHDSLTGVKNRRALNEDMSERVGNNIYLLLGDIDDFKFYNDSFGHNTGDKLLCVFAESMSKTFGKANVYRYGGDEFVAVMQDIDEDRFRELIARWRSTFAGVRVEGEHYAPTTSGGYVSGTPTTVEEVQDMLRLADIRLYDAKQAGRNKVLGMRYEGREIAIATLSAANLRERRSGNADALTGLPSMTYFLVHARSMFEAPTLADSQFFIVYFNIENMKAYNERFGMVAGDELLVFAAGAIKHAFERALITRVGDDRFILVTYDESPIARIEQVHNEVRAYSNEANVAIRAGVYEYERGVDVSSACDLAKLACDHIKGRHNVHFFVYNKDLREARQRKQFILDRFDEALKHGHIKAYYQPILRTLSGRVCEYEALARWEDPEEGFIEPDEFIPVLEECRLVHMLDLHIVGCVCRDIRDMTEHKDLCPLPVNVNLSRFDMGLCDIAAELAQIMRQHDVPANMLNIELTESSLSESRERLSEVIDQFHELGMQVWMDDFGSGYSSLNLLREFDFDAVKFDTVFLHSRNEIGRARSRMMLSHLIDMAKELGVQTLMEGVETQEQFEFLSTEGCEKVQGYAFEHPIPAEEIRSKLASGELKVERPEERLYYNPIGQVNLATPIAIDPEVAHSIELSEGMPAAIVEYRDGHISYLRWNSSYIDYLQDIGMNTIENSTAKINDHSRPQSQSFFKAWEAIRGMDGWLNLSFYEGEDLCTGMVRCVASNEDYDPAAFLYIAFNVTHYLSRAGLSVPGQEEE